MEKLRRKKSGPALTLAKQYLIGSFVLLSVIVFSSLYILEVSAHPFLEANSRAEEIAKTYAGLKTVSDVTIYNGSTTYYAVKGLDQQDQLTWVLVAESSSDLYVYPADIGISQEKAIEVAQENGAVEAKRVVLGYAEGQPIWEVKSGGSYYLIAFETGELVKKEGL